MSTPPLLRLAPLGLAPVYPADHHLEHIEVLESLRTAATSSSSYLRRRRLELWVAVERAFPHPGHVGAAIGLALASVTLTTLGLVAAVTAPETDAVARPSLAVAVAVAVDPAADPAVAVEGVDTVAEEMTAVVAAPAPPVPPPGDGADRHPKPPATPEGPPSAPPPPPVPPGMATDTPVLSRISPAPQPAPALATPELPPDPPGVAKLHRLSRAEVLATPLPALPVAESTTPTPVVPTDAGALPLGKGMWLYVPEEIEGGSVDALVARARHVGLTHVYVRTGSSKGGFYAQPYMDELLPKAHAAGIRVYGWDFPYLDDVDADVARAVAAITYTTPAGHRLDGFAADIETASEGTNLTAEGAAAYGNRLRSSVGTAYPLVAVVPRPSAQMQARYPYAAVIPAFDAVAPMTYWLNRQPDTDVINDVGFLSTFGKPVLPIGQAYDGAPEGGRPGPPPPEEIQRFFFGAQQAGAAGVSFWSWQHASQAIWDTIEAAPEFRWEARPPDQLRSEQIRSLQAQLSRLGYPLATTGTWDHLTADALGRYQTRAGLPPSGVLDPTTLAVLLAPFNPPVGALPGEDHHRDGIDLGLVGGIVPLG